MDFESPHSLEPDLRVLASYLATLDVPDTCSPPLFAMVVDVGHSFTHATPFYDGCCLNYGIRRMGVGGKLLTNHLKEIVSYRQWNLMEETLLVNSLKERFCFVSSDYVAELKMCKKLPARDNGLLVEYVLPDSVTGKPGHVKGPSEVDGQVLRLLNERFAVPELLFQPSDIGLEQAGVAECIAQSLEAVPEGGLPGTIGSAVLIVVLEIRPVLARNILVIGGSSQFPGFLKRL